MVEIIEFESPVGRRKSGVFLLIWRRRRMMKKKIMMINSNISLRANDIQTLFSGSIYIISFTPYHSLKM